MKYQDFLKTKKITSTTTGISHSVDLSENLYDFQKKIVAWSLRKGKAAIFADCGMGKTYMQVEWAKKVSDHTKKPVIIFAPLAVNIQTIEEALNLGVEITNARENSDITQGVNITNYERMHKFDCERFGGVVLDESSILKSQTGKYRTHLISQFKKTEFKLACTATPSPNDYMELGNHAEFLDVLTAEEMMAMYFIHDSSETQKWRLKKHAQDKFWEFVGSWAVMTRSPSDLGCAMDGYVLPPLDQKIHMVKADWETEGTLFHMGAKTLSERRNARKKSIQDRLEKLKEIVASDNESQWLIWVDYNQESNMISKELGAVEITGSDTPEHKSQSMLDFAKGKIRILVTKPSIAGFGMNWQSCHKMIFFGLSDSYEQYYQATRRCWRFGQKNKVDVHIVISEESDAVIENIRRKEMDHDNMIDGMIAFANHTINDKLIIEDYAMEYQKDDVITDKYHLMLGDCVERVSEIPDESVGYSVFSPPFASLYTYSSSERDMGNVVNESEFYMHFGYLIDEIYRVLVPGRLVSFHCMNLPATKGRDGHIGLKDFRGDLIRMFEDHGFIFASEVCIWKDPVTAMQRTKSIRLLNKQKNKDSSISGQGIPDYLVTMRKPGTNPEPIEHTNNDFPVSLWQKIASPVWMDINQSNVLGYRNAKDEQDEKHICPLQLDVIERALLLWSNPGDLVLSPFMGIASEGYQSIKQGRRFIGVELKKSYFDQAVKNMKNAEIESSQSKFI